MTTNPVTTPGLPMSPLVGSQQTTTKAGPNSSLGQDAFLKLLVAQLKYQDPLNPADGADFMAQTAQFTMVEKLAEMQKQGEATVTNQKQLQAIQLVGKEVSYMDEVGMLKKGIVESARFTPEGQTLTINGKMVDLGSVTEVIRDTSGSNLADTLADLSPTLSASVAAAIREALSSTKVVAETTPVTAVDPTEESSVVAPETSTETTSPDSAPVDAASPSDASPDTTAPSVSDTSTEAG